MGDILVSGGGPAIDVGLVERLLAVQFPQWKGLSVVPARPQGWDNRTFRLGTELTVRLPSSDHYAAQVGKEQRWLPVLAPHLPLPVPAPVAEGAPGAATPGPGRSVAGSTATPRRCRASTTSPRSRRRWRVFWLRWAESTRPVSRRRAPTTSGVGAR